MKKELYPWQEDCLETWFENRGRGMVQAVTGSGKTLLALTAAKRLEKKLTKNLKVKIVVPTSALMRQWYHALKDFFPDAGRTEPHQGGTGKKIGLRGAGHNSSSDCTYMIYVINSARYELARQILSDMNGGAAVLLIADECHRYTSGQNRLIFEFLPYIQQYEGCFFSLGLSATLPIGEERDFLSSVLGKRIFRYGIEQAISMHTVCRYDIFHIGLSFLPYEDEEYQEIKWRMSRLYADLIRKHPLLKEVSVKEFFHELSILAGSKDRQTAETASLYIRLSYIRKNLVCLASARISCVCELIQKLPQAEKILIFGERISQADELYGLLQKQDPGRIGRYHSQMGEVANRNTLDRFRDGSIRILIACKAVDEGIDVPDADVGIILSGTSTQRQRIQRLGRVIRNAEGKKSASLYYLHLKDTTEDACFLPESDQTQIFELEYLSGTKTFLNPPYDRAAEALLEQMRLARASSGELAEAERCLELGRVRSDWRLDRRELQSRMDGAGTARERNYWFCMQKISDERTYKISGK